MDRVFLADATKNQLVSVLPRIQYSTYFDVSLVQNNNKTFSRNKIILDSVDEPIAQKLEDAGFWRRASARWLLVMANSEYTEAQREWLLRRRAYCLARVRSPILPEKLDICEVAKAADDTLI